MSEDVHLWGSSSRLGVSVRLEGVVINALDSSYVVHPSRRVLPVVNPVVGVFRGTGFNCF